jgi:hypothetical protein
MPSVNRRHADDDMFRTMRLAVPLCVVSRTMTTPLPLAVSTQDPPPLPL